MTKAKTLGSRTSLWKVLLALYFVLLVCDGALRKWVWPELGVLVFGFKDVVLIVCLFIAFVSKASHDEKTSPRIPTYAVTLAFLWCALILLRVLPDIDSLAALIGLRYYLIGLPLAYLVYRLLSSTPDVYRLVSYVVLVAIATGLLGAVQFYSPPDSPINRYAWSTMENISGFGGELGWADVRARITSTFSYIATYAAFLQFALCILAAAALSSMSPWKRGMAIFALAIVAINILMTGSRAIALNLVLTFALFLLVFPRRAVNVVSSPLSAACAAILLLAMGQAVIDPFTALFERTTAVEETYGDAESRGLGALLMPFHTLADAGIYGLGVGEAFLGFGELRGYGGFEYRFDEIVHDRVGIELGAPIYLFVLFVKVLFVLAGVRIAVRSSSLEARIWATAMVVHQLMYVWTIPFYSPVASPLYFTSITVILFLQARERKLARADRSHTRHTIRPQLSGVK